MSWASRKLPGALAISAALALWNSPSHAEITLGEGNGWSASADGRINGFVSHIWGDQRPDGLQSLPWVGFNENTSGTVANSDNKLVRTRVRSGYVPSTLGFTFRKVTDGGLELTARAEIGMQIANVDPVAVGEPTWMDPRAVYLNVADSWGSIRAGRDFGLFTRGNLFMNFELGHNYGVGFPCAFEKVFGGACGHVGFGTLWPDFRAQITYTTPKLLDVVQISAGAFDPRTAPTIDWYHVPSPRYEFEATADYKVDEWGFKAWANGAYQTIGTSYNEDDPVTGEPVRKDVEQVVSGLGYGLLGYLGPVKVGAAGYHGSGMDAFEFLTFNPIYFGQGDALASQDRRFRKSSGVLIELAATLGDLTVMGGWGRAYLDRHPTDKPIDQVDAPPLIRTQTGISTGVFYRIGDFVLGLDYFNAHYGFDPKLTSQDDGSMPQYVEVEQSVNILNGGMTLEF